MNASHLLPDCEFLHEEVLAYKASLLCQETFEVHCIICKMCITRFLFALELLKFKKKMPEENPIRDCDRNKKATN